jgi:N-acetylglucosamine-6-phosphate deacetylase
LLTSAFSSITLIECVNNFLNWSGEDIPEALKAVTSTPAAMLGLRGLKGCLDNGADADLVVLSESQRGGKVELVVDEVWKFGTKVHSRC